MGTKQRLFWTACGSVLVRGSNEVGPMEGAPDVVIENLCSMYPLVNFCGSRGFLVSDLEHGDFSSAPRTPTAGLLWENVSTISVVGSEEWMSPGRSVTIFCQNVASGDPVNMTMNQ
ncbi:hypothetical protein B0H65DRAFT_439654 [Neurospora tetraspora]|uniref:Uncharacterized protein n=1 Tax=Neurospora tetraspora TaxID=94610 RepID=A0AAE0JJN3_9PEZI|nr:hypothetical protein B0H65DRAFT_439654 [Neurospora tetraspora]